MERLAAALFLDFGFRVRGAFDLVSGRDSRGSISAYKTVLERARPQDAVDGRAVKLVFTEQASSVLPRNTKFALRAWACYVAVQGVPDKPDPIDTLAKDTKARST